MSVQVSYKKQFSFGIILLLVIFSIMESGSRFYEFFIQDCGLENAETASEYDYFLKRYICYDQQIIEYSYQPVMTIVPNQHFTTININNDGFRGSEINTKMPHDYRIFVIGGSTVFGSGVADDNQTIPYELNKLFGKKFNNVEVINAGISSISSFEELFHFKEKILQLDPDLVIIYDGVNDIHSKKTTDPEISNSDMGELRFKDFQKYLRTPVVLYRYVLLPIINTEQLSYFDSEKLPKIQKLGTHYDPEISNSIGISWYTHLNEFCQLSNEKQIQSIVIVQPSLYHGKKPLTEYEQSIYEENEHFKKTFDILIEKSENLNDCSMVLNFSDSFENIVDGVYFDTTHLNNFGNKIIAEKIYEKILPIVLEDILK